MSHPVRFFGLALLGLALGSQTLACADVDDEELTGEDSAAAKGGKKKNKKDDGKKDGGKKGDGKVPEVPAAHRFSVVQHNVGGGAENGSSAENLAYTFAQIDEQKPDVVMLQEVCAGQVEAFKARYAGWDVRYTVMRPTHEGCGGASKGHVLASPRAFVEYGDAPLGETDGDKIFTLSCGGVPMPKTSRTVLACVTHLRVGLTDPDGSLRTNQVGRIVSAVRSHLAQGREVVIGGDLNVGPDKPVLDALYRLTTDGNYRGGAFDEADQTDPNRAQHAKRGVTCAKDACRSGADTTDSTKLDYVFFSHNRAVAVGAQSMGYGGSHHKLFHAWADLDL